MRIFIFLIFLFLFFNLTFAQDPVGEIKWDKDKGILNYTIPNDSLVKVRVGSAEGPVYRTLVNLEERKAGANQEFWDNRDNSGAVTFKDYEPLHFCIDTRPKPKKDLMLSTKLLKESSSAIGAMEVNKTLSINVDIDSRDKEWFSKDGVEIMVFLDNQLIKLEKVKTLPATLNLNFKMASQGKHLLTLNAWSGDHACVAYKHLVVLSMPLSGKIAYCQRQKGFWQVFTANLDGLQPQQLTHSLTDKRYPNFSPDGSRIAYVTNEKELWIMDSNEKNNLKVSLPINCSEPNWSPDGKKIVFVSYQDIYHGDTKIWQVELETLKMKKLINRPWLQYNPEYSPDANNIIFTDGPELYAQDIRKLNFETGDITQLTDNQPYDYDMQPAFFAAGESIAYSSNQDVNYDIWIMSKFGGDKKNLTKNVANDIMPQVTLDGMQVYFLSDRSGNQEVWRMDIEGGNLCQITTNKQDKQDLSLYTGETVF